MAIRNPFIHYTSYTHISGSLGQTGIFFWDSLLGNFEIVFMSSFLRRMNSLVGF